MNELEIITKEGVEYVRVSSLTSVFETDSGRFIYNLFRVEEGSVSEFLGKSLEDQDGIRKGCLYVKMEDAERDHLYGLGYSKR